MISRWARFSLGASLGAIVLWVCLRQPDHKLHEANISFSPYPQFGGTVKIAVTAADQNFVTIRMDLDFGRGSTGADSQWVNERSERCGYSKRNIHIPELPSPDGSWSIPCGWTDSLEVRRKQPGAARVKTFSPHSSIRDVVWSPDSRSLAVLIEEQRVEYFSRQGVLSLLIALQPLHLTHYRLFLYSINTGTVKELPFPYEAIQGAWATIEWSRV